MEASLGLVIHGKFPWEGFFGDLRDLFVIGSLAFGLVHERGCGCVVTEPRSQQLMVSLMVTLAEVLGSGGRVEANGRCLEMGRSWWAVSLSFELRQVVCGQDYFTDINCFTLV